MKLEWMVNRRKELGKTSTETAKELGIALCTYSLIESGQRQKRMTMPFAMALAKVLQMPLQEIIDREGVV